MNTKSGFTLIELLVTVAIAAVLMALAAPNLASFLKNNRLTTVTNDLLGDLAVARSEAAKRGLPVTICVSTDGASCTGGTDWLTGRVIYEGLGANTAPSTNSIIRVSQPASNGTTLSSSGFSSGSFVTYTVLGTISTGSTNVGRFKVCDDRTGSYGKLITITSTGRPLLQTAQSCP